MTGADLKRYLDAQMGEIASMRIDDEFAVSEAIRNRFRELLDRVCAEESVFPIIAPDGEHGLEAIWVALQYTVRICVDRDGEVWCTLGRPKERHHVEPFTEQMVEEVKHRLNELSDFVEKHNPHWRTFFLHSRSRQRPAQSGWSASL